MKQIKVLFDKNYIQSFGAALFTFLSTYPFTQEKFSWVSFGAAFVMFLYNFYTTQRAKSQTIAKVESGAIPVTVQGDKPGEPTNQNPIGG